MSPDPRRSSGEWNPPHPTPLPVPAYMTTAQFDTFVDEFRTFAGGVNDNFKELRKEMAQGSTRFALIDSAMGRQKERTDEHSGAIKILIKDKTVRDAKEEQENQDTAPRRDVLMEVVKAVIVAGVLGVCAVVYNAWRDQEVSKAAVSNPPVVKPEKSTP